MKLRWNYCEFLKLLFSQRASN